MFHCFLAAEEDASFAFINAFKILDKNFKAKRNKELLKEILSK